MKREEHYYTLEYYVSAGLDPFLDHVSQYLQKKLTVPVSKTRMEYSPKDIFFTFSDSLLIKFINKTDIMEKPYEVALKYGFRGHSIGGKNGIFYLRKSDNGLIKAMKGLVIANKKVIIEDLDINENGLDALKDVKIVWHNPKGERIVGSYNTKNGRIIFLDFASY